MAQQSDRDKSRLPHSGADHSAPYPVSRLAPAFGLVQLAEEVAQADAMVSGRANAQLALLAQQIRALQAQAREVMASAHEDMQLHRARCAFRKIPGKTYHLYRQTDGELHFSMLSAQDWRGQPPHEYLGAYRLENDLSWSPAEQTAEPLDAELLELLDLQKD